jgi:hypothetical protein
MKRLTFIIILISLVAMSSCKNNNSATAEDFSTLWQNYRQWKKINPRPLDYNITVHLKNSIRQIYANDKAREGIKSKESDGYLRVIYPAGSIVVKEMFKGTSDIKKDNPIALTVMIKEPEHPNAHRGWVYLFQAWNEKPRIIKGKRCLKCHEGANGKHPYCDKNKEDIFRDFLYAPIYKK